MMLTDLAQVVRSTGLTVVELPGWKTRGRPASAGPFNPKGVLCHHTGGSADSRKYVEWMTYTGRPEDHLPPPLCQLALARTGLVYVCAAGRANHAGKTKAIGGWLAAGDGNAQLIGIEAMNLGTEGWAMVQYDAYLRLCAALCRGYRWPASRVLGHKETSLTGKWDPGEMNMTTFRANVHRALQHPLPPPPPTPEDSMSAAEVAQIKAHIDDVIDALRRDLGVHIKAETERDSQFREETGTQWTGEAARDAAELGVLGDIKAKLDTVIDQTKPTEPTS